MQKSNYNISILNGKGKKPLLVSIPGYIFYYSGQRYGISNYYCFNGKPEKGFTWTITELTSGYSIGMNYNGATRKGAIDHLLTSEKITRMVEKAVKMYLEQNNNEDANPGLIPDNEFLTVHTRYTAAPPGEPQAAHHGGGASLKK